MLNIELLENLYKGLTKEKKHELKDKLFGGSNQSLTYFRKNKDTSMSKLETLADFFNLPLDGLRADSDYVYDNRIKRIVDPKYIVKDCSSAVEATEEHGANQNSLELERLEMQNKVLKDTIAVKEERIEVLLERIAILQERLAELEISKNR